MRRAIAFDAPGGDRFNDDLSIAMATEPFSDGFKFAPQLIGVVYFAIV
jgi:hypothetical protein